MMKKYKSLCASLTALIAVSSFGGCTKTEKTDDNILDSSNPVTITVWHYYNGVQQTAFDNLVSDFNDTVGFEKGIIVEAFSKSSISDLAAAVTASVKKDAGAENPPDIFATYSETAYIIDKQGALADLNEYLTDEERAEYIPSYMDEGDFGDGSLKIFPTAKSTEVMMLNLTDWEKFAQSEGVSAADLSTLEGLTKTAEKYYNYTDAMTPDVPNDGKAFFGRDSVANYMYIGAKQLDCEFIKKNDDGSYSPCEHKDAVKKLWENYYVPYVKGYFTAKSRYRSDDAKTGSIIALICSTTGAAYFPSEVTIGDDYSYPIENMLLEVPSFEGAEPYLVQQGAGMSVIKSDKKSEYASTEFLKWFTEADRNISFSVGSGYLPVKQAANDYEKIVSVNSSLETPINNVTLLNTIEAAIGEVRSRPLYTSKPFDKSTETRDYIGNVMQNTAADDYAAAWERIAGGEDRTAVLDEYTGDAAFEKWYENFISGLSAVISG